MKTALALAAALLCVSATPVIETEGRTSNSIPPERFRALGVVVTVFVPFNQLPAFCGVREEPGKVLLGCTRFLKANGKPVIFMPDPCPAAMAGEYYARIQCHENAHALGGWTGDHPR